ncbi:MAG: autotransporter outer membrane beta-barrel domain-containing protein, partial [Luteolibacter sp.]
GAISDEVLDGSNTIDANNPFDSAAIGIVTSCGNGDFIATLSPEGYAGFTDYPLQVTRNYTRAAMTMPGVQMDGTVTQYVGASNSKEPLPAPAPTADRYTTVFGGFTHFNAETDSSGRADYELESNGGILGVRHTINQLTFGGFLGYDSGDIDSGTINADVDGWLVGGFASYIIKPENNLLVRGGVTYGEYEYDGVRNGFGGPYNFGGVDANAWDVFVEVQMDVYKSDRLTLTPTFGIHYVNSDVDGFTETGGTLPLSVRSMSDEALLAEIELRAEYMVTDKFFVNGTVGYSHNFMDSDRTVNANFVGGGTPFSVRANGFSEDIFSVGVGATWYATDALSLGVNARAEFGSDQETTTSLGIGAAYSF